MNSLVAMSFIVKKVASCVRFHLLEMEISKVTNLYLRLDYSFSIISFVLNVFGAVYVIKYHKFAPREECVQIFVVESGGLRCISGNAESQTGWHSVIDCYLIDSYRYVHKDKVSAFVYMCGKCVLVEATATTCTAVMVSTADHAVTTGVYAYDYSTDRFYTVDNSEEHIVIVDKYGNSVGKHRLPEIVQKTQFLSMSVVDKIVYIVYLCRLWHVVLVFDIETREILHEDCVADRPDIYVLYHGVYIMMEGDITSMVDIKRKIVYDGTDASN